jgi:FtsP/CotA-like multicopper oxidase with cupredoxin domain
MVFFLTVLSWGAGAGPAGAALIQDTNPNSPGFGYYVPDYFGPAPNWANSPQLQKFVDGMPGICGTPTGTNSIGQCVPAAVPDQATYPGSDYYEIEVVEFRERMHTAFPALNNPDKMLATTGGTKLRGYRQLNVDAGDPARTPHYLGPLLITQKDRPVRIKLVNSLPFGAAGNLFVPVDLTVMGAGNYTVDYDPQTKALTAPFSGRFAQNRAVIHLHGGRSPWISDGTPHQWITPAGENQSYGKGVSVSNVPDMWFDATGTHITNTTYPGSNCAGQTTCSVAGATNNPGAGAMTYFWSNQQSARFMFYHEHAWGITRLGVYAGLAAGYIIRDAVENALINGGTVNGREFLAGTIPADEVALVVQDKTFVDATGTTGTNPNHVMNTDPTWAWGSIPGQPVGTAVTGDLWWPHVYMPAQNPYNPDLSGVNPMGRWMYGPWFWPPTTNIAYGPVPNPYYGPASPSPEMPGTPNPSWGAEAFLDTPVINGTAYPTLTLEPKAYRFRILNAAHDRFFNLQLYIAADKATTNAADPTNSPGLVLCDGTEGVPLTNCTEVKMVTAAPTAGWPATWPTDGRVGGVPDPATSGPSWIQIGTEGGFLPAPVVMPNQPINWITDPTLFTAGLVMPQAEGGGTLQIGPAERADVILDFSAFRNKTLILYNDAPAPWPALDPHYDYYTGAPDLRSVGGADTPLPGFGPNTRTLMQIKIADVAPAATFDLAKLQAAFTGANSVFAQGQHEIIAGQTAYDATYAKTFPTTWPYWGISRISDSYLSYQRVDGTNVSSLPMKAKAIQDEMGETFDDYGRMSAKLGLELPFTTALNQTFVMQNFVDPATEKVKNGEVQIWKITHNGVDTHPIHFHLFEVQLLNRVGWDGFITMPDPNELGWKETLKVNPLQDTIVALRPVAPSPPFPVPNSVRPLNPSEPLGSTVGFTNIDPLTAQPVVPPVTNRMENFGHEYVWHCHILSHEEMDMMRPIVMNADSLLYAANTGLGIWQWDLGVWRQLNQVDPAKMAASGAVLYADFTGSGIWKHDGNTWTQLNQVNPSTMVSSGGMLYADFTGSGIWKYDGTTWSQLNQVNPSSMVASGSDLYADFTGSGIWRWNGTSWTQLNTTNPSKMVVSGSLLYVDVAGSGIWVWNGTSWTQLNTTSPTAMVASGSYLYADIAGSGIWQWNGTIWSQLNTTSPAKMVASGANLFADIAGSGIWQWNGKSWSRLNSTSPEIMLASGSLLYADIPGSGIYKWETNAWTQLTATDPSMMASGF